MRLFTWIAILAFALSACSDDDANGPALAFDGASGGVDTVTSGDSGVDTGNEAEVVDSDVKGDAADAGPPLLCDGTPKPFLCPCTETSDCESGFCVDGPEGGICTRPCLTDACPDGFSCKGVLNLVPDVVFICVPDALELCAPCATDVQCGSGRCLGIGGGSYCTQDCTNLKCPAGYTCGAHPAATDAGLEQVCLPATGACDCGTDTVGATRPCSTANDEGQECHGIETCDPLQGWVGCTALPPAPESCNGTDDDCNGIVDDGLPVGEPCDKVVPEVGACPGTSVCLGVNGMVCNAPDPAPELCDFQDNDCDGLVDEDFKDGDAYANAAHCGTCNKSCALGFPNGDALCDGTKAPPQCVVASCDEGYFKFNEFQCIPVTTSLCQPCATDADCFLPGARCMPIGDGSYCGKPCAGEGDCPFGYDCAAFGGGSQCQPASGTCECDGTNPDLKKSCSLSWQDPGDPSAPVTTCLGIQSCDASGWGACELPPDACDGVDNDCDGAADEGYVDAAGRYVTDEDCGQCGNNCLATVADHATGTCDAGKPVPECALSCDPGFVDVNANPTDGCECEVLGGDDVPDGVDSDCDGVDGEVQNAVFVAKDGSDTAVGSIFAPVRTVQRGIERAQELGLRDVYVATGVYQETISLVAGVGLYGGYSSDFQVRDRVLYETVVMGSAPTATLKGAVNLLDLGGSEVTTALDGFTVFGHSTTVPGKSSYAIYLRNPDASVAVAHNVVIAGNGGDGLPGSGGASGEGGAGGAAGLPATEVVVCEGTTNAGGGGGVKSCGGAEVTGGEGGTSVCPDYDDSGNQPYSPPITQSAAAGESGGPGANNAEGSGLGGGAGWDFLKWSAQVCTNCISPPAPNTWTGGDGVAGTTGTSGVPGAACSDGGGKILAGEWVPGVGASGKAGTAGGGGGGGGAGGGVELSSCGDGGTDLGGSGGGGGSGGCGASGGGGGSGGGGSFAIFIVWTQPATSAPVVADNTIRTGQGGKGGSGGTGGVGGSGGAGAGGGKSGASSPTTLCAGQGGHGGNGGAGGHGGGGGGGCGGASFGIFASGAGGVDLAALKAAGNVFEPGGTGGVGGLGGPSLGEAGDDGAFGPTASTNF